MSYILSQDRYGTPDEIFVQFNKYKDYISANEERFPRSAYEVASSSWYYSLEDPRAPHDGSLEEFRIIEHDAEAGQEIRRVVDIHLRLLNARHDRHLTFAYQKVAAYSLDLSPGNWGHRDWRYDEFRLTDDGLVVHEIEWSGPRDTARWKITATDIQYKHSPVNS